MNVSNVQPQYCRIRRQGVRGYDTPRLNPVPGGETPGPPFFGAPPPLAFATTVGDGSGAGQVEDVATQHTRRVVNAAATGTVVVFVLSVVALCTSVVLCLCFPVGASVGFRGHTVPSDAHCVRANRHSDYVEAEVHIGTPPVLHRLLVRLDTKVDSSQRSLLLFSTHASESASVTCERGTALCADATRVQLGGVDSPLSSVVVPYQYVSSAEVASVAPVAQALGMHGELRFVADSEYWITDTHLCTRHVGAISSADNTDDDEVVARFELLFNDGVATLSAVNASALRANAEVCASMPALACNVSVILFSPVYAGLESSWLGVPSNTLYERGGDPLAARRDIVEMGRSCVVATVLQTAATDDARKDLFARTMKMYEMDCRVPYTRCDRPPSVAFRRVSKRHIHMRMRSDKGATIWFGPEMPHHSDRSADSLQQSLTKLVLMTFASGVIWIRSAKNTASSSEIFLGTLHSLLCSTSTPEARYTSTQIAFMENSYWEDALVGTIAILVRAAVVLGWRRNELIDDGQTRVFVAEIVATGASALLFVARYTVHLLDRRLKHRCTSPLSKLGGSTALVDATCTVMLAFSDTPLLVSSVGRFDPTARLLVALLLLLFSFHRCFLACACCGMVYRASCTEVSLRMRFPRVDDAVSYTQRHPVVSLMASLLWIVQTAAVGVLLTDLFVTPLIYSMTRAIVGGRFWMSLLLASLVCAASLPRLLHAVDEIVGDSQQSSDGN